MFAFCGCSSDAASDNSNTGGQGIAGTAAGGRSVGGTGGTGGNTADAPNYAVAFPQDKVATLNLTIRPEDWQRMLADMTTAFGEFGSRAGDMLPGGAQRGPNIGGTLPAELLAACEGLATGTTCSADLQGMKLQGVCVLIDGNAICQPSMDDAPGGMLVGPGGGPDGKDPFSHTPIYVEASVEFAGHYWDHVGVRFKGNSSLGSAWSGGSYKLPMRLDFDHFEELYPETRKQRFLGFEHLSLANGWSDATLVRDKLGTEIFGKFGIAVPATAFYRVVVDHGEGPIYFGLYTAIELPSDHSFLDRAFGSHDGNLYKPEGKGATWAVYDQASLGKENHEDDADFSDVSALFDALHADRTDSSAFRAGLEQRLNVDGFLRWLALNTLIQDWDVYGNMSHNYYLYAAPADSHRFQWIPWDHTFAFGGDAGISRNTTLGHANVTDQWPLIRYLMDDAVYAARYRAFVADAASAYSSFAQSRFQNAHDLIAEFVVGASGETPQHTLLRSPQDFDAAHTALLSHPGQRAAAAAAFVRE